MKKSGITRREFLIGGAAAFAAAGMPRFVAASDATGASLPLIGSAPVLMNPAERTMDVVFALNGEASGWVDIAKSPDMKGAVRVYSGEGPVMRVCDKFAVVRIAGLRPATRYWYRIGADRIELENGYKPWNRGAETDERIYSLMTLGAERDGSFCVMQDTHSVPEVVDTVFGGIAACKPSVVVWNGDARNFYRTADDAVGTFLKPHPNYPAYAAETPILFLNGNHDYRGRFALHLNDLVPFRCPIERKREYSTLGRNFVQRIGDIALIGLDTGEDKQDTNPRMGGIFRMTKYRELQTRWLTEEIEKPAVKTAKFKVAFCHIPLFDPRTNENPGDVLPDDDDPRYKHPWAAWQRTCANMWGPLFAKAGVQLVCTGHQHRYRYDAPSAERPWTHIVGGQRDVIEGRVADGRLVVKVHDCENGRIVFDKEFE